MVTGTLNLFAVGDLQLMTREPPADLFAAVTPVLSEADITFGNCEWPYAEEAGDTHPVEAHINDDFDDGDLFVPGAPESIAMMAAAGFDVMSVANNHTMHGGYRAFLRTISLLRASGIAHVGGGENIVTARQPVIVDGDTGALLVRSVAPMPDGVRQGSCRCAVTPMQKTTAGRIGELSRTRARWSTARISPR